MSAQFFHFQEFTVFYYSTSGTSKEAAYINCFNDKKEQVGSLRFFYDGAPLPANAIQTSPTAPTMAVMNYALSRFSNVLELLRSAKAGAQAMVISADVTPNIYALCNNLHVPAGSH